MKFDPLRHRTERAIVMERVRQTLEALTERLEDLSAGQAEFVSQIAEQTCMGHVESAPISDAQCRYLEDIARKTLPRELRVKIL